MEIRSLDLTRLPTIILMEAFKMVPSRPRSMGRLSSSLSVPGQLKMRSTYPGLWSQSTELFAWTWVGGAIKDVIQKTKHLLSSPVLAALDHFYPRLVTGQPIIQVLLEDAGHLTLPLPGFFGGSHYSHPGFQLHPFAFKISSQ